jgi:2-keto-4-pentenoate hydratase
MLTPTDLALIAREVKNAQDHSLQLEPITARHSGFDVNDAYAVARTIHDEHMAQGARPLGRKIGFTNPAMWARYGVGAPVWAYMYNSTLRYLTPATASCSLWRFVAPKIEPEIVFHFHAAPPQGGGLDAILACIDWVAHGFEIVQSHYPGWKFQAADAVADWGMHATLLIGEPHPVKDFGAGLQDALEAFTIELACDGELLETGKGANVLGSPLAAVSHLVSVLAAQSPSQPIQAGEIITTGTITAAYDVRPGQAWQTTLQGIALEGLSLRFTE